MAPSRIFLSLFGVLASSTLSFAAACKNDTNGASYWDTPLRHYIDYGEGRPWGNKTAYMVNPADTPNTGRVVKYDWTITRQTLDHANYGKDMLLVNGQFPGPLLEANWGDTIEVTVHNRIEGPVEGSGIHFHGFTQKKTPWMDGVPSVSSCPMAPGTTFVHTFQADEFGTSWYHSHYSAQYIGGLIGPMVIHGPVSAEYDIDLGPIILTEWYHKDYVELLSDVMGTNSTLWRPLADDNLINGQNYNCSIETDTDCTPNDSLATFNFTKGKTHRLRLINSGAADLQHFTIDGHNMTVIANDFVAVKPYTTNVVTLAVGQRTDVLVEAHGPSNGAYWMRTNVSDFCAFSFRPEAKAAIYYNDADTTLLPTSAPWPRNNATYNNCNNDDLALTVPAYPIPAVKEPDVTLYLDFNRTVNATGHQVWTVNEIGMRGNYNYPILQLANQGNYSYMENPELLTFDMGSNTTVRLVMYEASGAADHPMHLHGHDMQILASGSHGRWDEKSLTNMGNPLRRDVHQLPRGGYTVVQYEQDNPGAWPFHCHIAWHLSTGFFMTLVERPDDIQDLVIPDIIEDQCVEWDQYSNWNVVDQIDSGV